MADWRRARAEGRRLKDVAHKYGVTYTSLRNWIVDVEREEGIRPGLSVAQRAEERARRRDLAASEKSREREARRTQFGEFADLSRACSNPDCDETLTWSGARGRPRYFCSPACNKRARATFDKLERLIRAELLTPGPELERLAWLYSAYPPGWRESSPLAERVEPFFW